MRAKGGRGRRPPPPGSGRRPGSGSRDGRELDEPAAGEGRPAGRASRTSSRKASILVISPASGMPAAPTEAAMLVGTTS